MLTLHNKDFTTKYGTINTTIEAFVEEERNGLFELSFIMLNTDSLFNYVKEDNIVVANANDTLLNQKFRIYMTRKLMNNRVEVFARHISFDLMYDYIDNISFENQSCEYALNMLFRNSNFSKHYKGYSDIINAQDYSMSMANILEAIGGKEGSIIDTFGTGVELLRDNENIYVLNKRGYDNSVYIEYKKNLTGFELEEDTTELITRILPYAKYTPQDEEGNSQDEVVIKASFVDSPLIANYSHPFIKAIDYSDKFEEDEEVTTSKLITFAQNEYRDNKVDIPKQNFKIEFIPLSKCVGYEGLSDNISLCDTVTILDTRYNINTQAKVIKTTYNVLKNRYESMELGEPKTSLGDIIGNNDSSKGEKGDKGDKGEPGKDGNIGDFPNSLPSTPVVTAKVYGFANIEISWTFENKVYYQYEVYASKEADFIPNTFNLIHSGQTSTYMYQAKPNETWHFKVCCVNSHGERTDFGSAYATTTKIDDLSNYVGEMAIGEALIGTLSLDRGWVGSLKGNYINAKQLSVTDGNGKRTLDIDSFGNVNLDVTSLKIKSSNVPTSNQVISPGNAIADINVTPGNVKISANKIDLNGAVTAGSYSQGHYVKINQENYNVYRENINTMTMGTLSHEGKIVPVIWQGADGHSGGRNYGGILHQGNRLLLTHYNADRLDWSELSFYDNGIMELNPANILKLSSGMGIELNSHIVPYAKDTIFIGKADNPFSDVQSKNFGLSFDGVNHGNIYGRDGRVTIEAKEGHDIYLSTAWDAIRIDADNGHLTPTKYNRQSLGCESADYRWTKVCLLSNPDVSSDLCFKENIKYLGNSEGINTIDDNAITVSDMYAFIKNDLKLAEYNYKGFKKSTIGFVAQDIENSKVGKKLIHKNDDNKLSYDTGTRISIVEGALKKAIEKIEELEKEIDILKARNNIVIANNSITGDYEDIKEVTETILDNPINKDLIK